MNSEMKFKNQKFLIKEKCDMKNLRQRFAPKRTVHKGEVHYRADACKYKIISYPKLRVLSNCIAQQLIKFFTSNSSGIETLVVTK